MKLLSIATRLVMSMLALILMLPLAAHAITPATARIDLGRASSLTVLARTESGVGIEGAAVTAYRIAEPQPTYAAVPDFAEILAHVGWSAFTVDDHETEVWDSLAATIRDYVVTSGREPSATGVTDSEGRFAASGLTPGMYLVSVASVTQGETTYTFSPALVAVPGDDGEGGLTYDVVVEVKYTTRVIPSSETFRVVKQWNDRGVSGDRPSSVTVDIFKNGTLSSTQVLSPDNDWTYSWSDYTGSTWTVVERFGHLPYTVANTREGSTFIVTNSRVPDEPPSTPPTETTPPGQTTPPGETPSMPDAPPSQTTPPSKPGILQFTGFGAQYWYLSAALVGFGMILLVVSRKRDEREQAIEVRKGEGHE